MGRVADPKLAALWRRRVELQLESGLSVLDYCRRAEISTARFHSWKRRFRITRASAGQVAGRRTRRQAARGQRLSGGFVQVPLTVSSAVEVRFVDGTTVRVPAEHFSATLKMLKAPQSEGARDD
jgi:hypothetical protein